MRAVGIPMGVFWENREFAVKAKPDHPMPETGILPGWHGAADDVAVMIAPEVGEDEEVGAEGDADDQTVHAY